MIAVILICLLCCAAAYAFYTHLILQIHPLAALRRSCNKFAAIVKTARSPLLTAVPSWWTIRNNGDKILREVVYHGTKCPSACLSSENGLVATKSIRDDHYKHTHRVLTRLASVAYMHKYAILDAKFIHVTRLTRMESHGGSTIAGTQDYEIYLYSSPTERHAWPYVQTDASFTQCKSFAEAVFAPRQTRVYMNQTKFPLIVLRITFAKNKA